VSERQTPVSATTAPAPGPENPSRRARLLNRERRIGLGVVATLVIAWLVLTLGGFVRPLFVPGPADLARAYEQLAPQLPGDVWDSVVTRLIPGFFVGLALGMLVGISMAVSRTFRALADPIVEAIRPLPPLALIPLFILWFGIGSGTQVALIAFGTFIVMVITAYEAVRNVPPIYLQAAATLGASRRQVVRRVIVPAIVPDIFGGVRVAVAASFGYVVVAEIIGAQSGLGYRLVLARRYLLTENIVAILIVVGILAFLADQLVRWINRRLTDWKPRA
jgi:ABC-type nitrate/sulfonate/bicarbonate transport system permease component